MHQDNMLTQEFEVPNGVDIIEVAGTLVDVVMDYENQDNGGKKDWQVLQVVKKKGSEKGIAQDYLSVEDGYTHTIIIKICNARYADGLLEKASDRPLSVLMPCSLTLYITEDDTVVIDMVKQKVMEGIIKNFSENAQALLYKVGQQMNEMVQETLERLK